MTNPYSSLGVRNFWGKSVRDLHYLDLEELSCPISIKMSDKVATAGSCFAQHIGRHLKNSGFKYLDMEPKPDFIDDKDSKRFGYNVYSCRYGNIYTTRQLLQLVKESQGLFSPAEVVWEKNGRFFDALRPSVDPIGYEKKEEVLKVRANHLKAVSKMLTEMDVLVFTMGLTEAWISIDDGTTYPTAPGTIAGDFSNGRVEFKNFRYNEIHSDFMEARDLIKKINPKIKFLLTVSPVPLNATASSEHVLVASSRSKAVLRAVAGDLAEDYDDIFYFPSYEIISSHPSRGMFFQPNLREVNDGGVKYVMKHFFESLSEKQVFDKSTELDEDDDIICDEEVLEQFSER